MIEIEPSEFNKILRSAGLSDAQIREINMEFSKNNDTLDDESVLEMILKLGKDLHTIITVFEKLGVGKHAAVDLIEAHQKRLFGGAIDTHRMEVDGL